MLTQDRSVAQKPHWGFCCCANASLPWQAEQAHHIPSKEKQGAPDGERPVVHIAIVCGSWQGASGWRTLFLFLPAAGEPTISMTALLELLKDADPEMKAKLRLALLT